VLSLSQTSAGTAPDKKIADYEDIAYRPNPILYQDTGFQGDHPPGTHVRQPKKNRADAN
jgi:hypothetical protein